MYSVEISPQALKELHKLKKLYHGVVKNIVAELKEDPHTGKPLERNLTRKFSHRFGVYRVLYKINEKDKLVEILSFKHRSVAYQ